MNTKLDHALSLAELGFRVFPLIPNSKTPTFKRWTEKATVDRAIIKAHWQRHPDDNIAILTGEGLIVLDEDNKHDTKGSDTLFGLELANGDLPATLTNITPTAGKHYLFRSDIDIHNSVSRIGDELDVRGYHGFIVAPGSTLNGQPYQWANPAAELAQAPPWLEEMALRANPRLPKQSDIPLNGFDHPQAISRAQDYLRSALPAVQGDHGDLTTLKTAMHLKDFGLSEGAAIDLMLDVYNERCSPPWHPDEMLIKVGNAYRYGKNQPGIADPVADFGVEPVAESVVNDSATPKPKRRVRILGLEEIKKLKPPAYVIEGIVTELGFTLVEGAQSSFKSFLTLDWLLCMAYGRPWCGKPVAPRAVLYVAGEGVGGVQKRIHAWQIEHKVEDVWAPFYMLETGINFTQPGHIAQLKEEAAELVAREGVDIKFIAVDTVARAMVGADESGATDMGIFIEACDGLRRHFGCGLIADHHLGKDKERGSRGSNALPAAADTEILVERQEGPNDMLMLLRIKKQKDDEEGPDRWFEAVKVSLPAVDLDMVSSLVLRPTEAPALRDEEGASDDHRALARDLLEQRDGAAMLPIKAMIARLEAHNEFYRPDPAAAGNADRNAALSIRIKRVFETPRTFAGWVISCPKVQGSKGHRRIHFSPVSSDKKEGE